jgi:TIR domain
VQLEAAGYTTLLQAWDFRPGSDFLHEMQQATTTAGRTIAVLSPAYLGSAFGEAEWRAAFAKDPTGERGLLVPVRVQPCAPPGLLASRVYIDLVDTDEPTAKQRLLGGSGPVGCPTDRRPVPRHGQRSEAVSRAGF